MNSETWHKLKWPLLALGLLLLFNFIFSPGFFRVEIKDGRFYGSLIDVFNRAAPVMLLALGMTLVIATGGVDLSVGAVMALSGSLAATLLTQTNGLSFPVAAAVALGAALFAGAWNGVLVGFFQIQPIVATLILMVAGRGMAQLVSGGQIVTFDNPGFNFIAGGSFLGLPFPLTIVAVALMLTALLTQRTPLGLYIESVGDNEVASRLAGIQTRKVKSMVYAFCGFMAGVAGLIAASDIKAADANNAGVYLELDAILAVVIGGTALTGGRFYLLSSLVAALLIQAMTTTILTRGIPVEYTLVVKAIVIIVVCLLQSENFRRALLRLRPAKAQG